MAAGDKMALGASPVPLPIPIALCFQKIPRDIRKHWGLVFVVYSFLHLDCLPVPPIQGQELPIKTIVEASRQQAQAFIQAFILHTHNLLKQDVNVQMVFETLFAKQMPFSPAVAG
jgi:hypothetical protein